MPDRDVTPRAPGPGGSRWVARVTATTLVVLALIAIMRARRNPDAPSIAAHPSIAVLRFDEADTLSTGYSVPLAEAIVAGSRKAGGLSVSVIGPRTTSRYDGNTTPLDTIARHEGATHILSGTVRRASDGVHVYAQLVRVADRRHIWVLRLRDSLPGNGLLASIADSIAHGAVRAIGLPR